MPEMHLKQPGFTYSACGPFTKNKRKNSKIYATGKHKLHLGSRKITFGFSL